MSTSKYIPNMYDMPVNTYTLARNNEKLRERIKDPIMDCEVAGCTSKSTASLSGYEGVLFVCRTHLAVFKLSVDLYKQSKITIRP